MPKEAIDTQLILYQLRRNGITNRNDIVKVLKQNGLTSYEANQVMSDGGFGNLTRAERSLFPKTYSGQVWKGVGRNLKEIAASFPTLAGLAIRTIGSANMPTRLQEQQVTQMRKFQQENPEIMKDPLGSLYNTILGQYNIDTQRTKGTVKRLLDEGYQGPQLSLDDIIYGVADNPLYAGLDITTLGGSGLVKGAGKVAGQTRAGKRLSSLRQFNRILNTASLEEGKAFAKQEPILKEFTRQFRSLSKEGKNAVSRALQQTGETDLGKKSWNKALDLARKSSLDTSNKMIELGLITKEQNANNIIANYIGNNIGWNKIDHNTILDWVENPERMPNALKPLYEKGKKLQSEGNLAFVSQAVNPATNNLGTSIDIAPSYYQQKRFVGTRTPEEMAGILPQALDFQARHTARHQGLQNFAERLTKYKPEPALFSDVNTKQYSLEKLMPYIEEKGKAGVSANKIMRSLPEATKEEIAAGKALSIPEAERNALARFFEHGGGSNEYLNMFKRAVLGGTKWFTENRIQNTLGNIIEGVTPRHYAKAAKALKTGDYPKELDVLTRSYGYAGNLPTPATGAAMDALKRMGLGIKGAFTHVGEKDIKGALRSLGEVPLGFADLISNPMFDLEAQADRLERMANYEKQIEDLAKQTKSKPDVIRQLAKTNPYTFETLYSSVNRSLGDYTSRNYYMPRTTQDILEAVSPFWRFPYNTIRTTTHQIMDKPIGTQLMTIIPSKIGRDVWYDKVEPMDVEMKGGYPTGRVHPTSGKETMITTQGHPLTAVINQLGSLGDIGTQGPEELTQGVSPIMSTIYPLTLRNSFGKPAQTKDWGISRDPATGTEVLFKKDPKTGLPIYDEQNLNPLEYTGWLGSQLLKQYYSPTVHGMNETRKITKGLIEPLQRAITTDTPLKQALEQATMYPAWDNELFPWVEGDVTKNPTVGAASILSPLVGVREVAPYTVPEKTKRNAFKSMAKKMQKRKTPFLEGYIEYNENR